MKKLKIEETSFKFSKGYLIKSCYPGKITNVWLCSFLNDKSNVCRIGIQLLIPHSRKMHMQWGFSDSHTFFLRKLWFFELQIFWTFLLSLKNWDITVDSKSVLIFFLGNFYFLYLLEGNDWTFSFFKQIFLKKEGFFLCKKITKLLVGLLILILHVWIGISN